MLVLLCPPLPLQLLGQVELILGFTGYSSTGSQSDSGPSRHNSVDPTKKGTLQELFPDKHLSTIVETLDQCEGDIGRAAERLLLSWPRETNLIQAGGAISSQLGSGNSVPSLPGTSTSRENDILGSTCQQILKSYLARFTSNRVFDVTVRRGRLWRDALSFYKNSLHSLDRLKHELRIEFRGEEGIDAGALRREFFESLLKELNNRLFEGEDSSRLPKYDSNVRGLFETAGMMIGHSVVQGGPSFSCICPAAYSYMLYGDRELSLAELPTIADIPRNAATHDTITLIEAVS